MERQLVEKYVLWDGLKQFLAMECINASTLDVSGVTSGVT
jgi:hypothetical protein